MSNSCTIYSSKDYNEILVYFEDIGFSDVTDSEGVKSFQRHFIEGTLRISLKQQIKRGDGFSSLIRGTCNFFDNIETKYEEQKKELTTRILSCKTAIGLVSEPEYVKDDKRADYIYKLAEMFDGIIFNGSEMIDKSGKLILDDEGNSELG
jgi:hypothetical protein